LYVPLAGMKRMVDIPKFMGRWCATSISLACLVSS